METGLVKYQNNSMTITELRNLAMDFAKSGYFSDAREAAQAVVKIQAGVEMGFGPVYSMTKIYIVKGKVMVSAEALGAMVKRSGCYDYRVKTLTDIEAVLEFTDNEKPVYTSKFNMEDAKRADLLRGDSGWAKWPRAMLMSKAISQGARIVCPHVIAGVYTPADFGVETDEAGEPKVIVDSTATMKAEPPPVEMITEAQRKKIFATAKEKGITEEQVKNYIQKVFGVNHTADLNRIQAGNIIEALLTGEAITTTDASQDGCNTPENTKEDKKDEPKANKQPETLQELLTWASSHGKPYGPSWVAKEAGVKSASDIKNVAEVYQSIKQVTGWED